MPARTSRLYQEALRDAVDAAGGLRAWRIIGPVFRKALVAAAILRILAIQDENVLDHRVREMLFDLAGELSNDEEIL